MIHWYDKQGRRISIQQANEYLGNMEYKRVAETTIGNYWVSTVWLGLDHGWNNDNLPPLIFETMVFATEDMDPAMDLELSQDRYYTEAEALAGHEAIVLMIRATIQEEPDVGVLEEAGAPSGGEAQGDLADPSASGTPASEQEESR